MLRLLAVVALLVPFAGCAGDEALAHLIQIHEVAQTWEQPSELSLRGEGFPHGVRGEAVLNGTLFAVGGAGERITLRVPCRALSSSQALVELSESDAVALREGPFEGTLEVRFGALSSARLVGRASHVLIRLGTLPTALDQRFALRQRAQAFQRGLGITALELGERGVSVSQLDAAGSAAAAGLTLGDSIVRVDGAPVQLPIDVLGRALRNGSELTVQRSGERSTLLLTVHGARSRSALPWFVSLMCAVFGAALAVSIGAGVRSDMLWAPRRREYWLMVVSCGSLSMLALLLLDGLDPLLRELLRPSGYGFLLAVAAVCLCRRLRPTVRTGKDPALAPLL